MKLPDPRETAEQALPCFCGAPTELAHSMHGATCPAHWTALQYL